MSIAHITGSTSAGSINTGSTGGGSTSAGSTGATSTSSSSTTVTSTSATSTDNTSTVNKNGIYAVFREFGNVVNRAFLVLIFWVNKFVGANFTRFCNYASTLYQILEVIDI